MSEFKNAFRKSSNRFSDLETDSSYKKREKKTNKSVENTFIKKQVLVEPVLQPVLPVEQDLEPVITDVLPRETKFLDAIKSNSYNPNNYIKKTTVKQREYDPYTDINFVMNKIAHDIGVNRERYIRQYESIHGENSFYDSLYSNDFYPPNEEIEHYDFDDDSDSEITTSSSEDEYDCE